MTAKVEFHVATKVMIQVCDEVFQHSYATLNWPEPLRIAASRPDIRRCHNMFINVYKIA
jgi:hypothetical protein